MSDRRNGNTRRVDLALHFPQGGERLGLKFLRESSGADGVRVEYAGELRVFDFAIHACVVAAKFPAADDGHTNARIGRGRHFFSIPIGEVFGSMAGTGGTA
jgi:hypothetical protein